MTFRQQQISNGAIGAFGVRSYISPVDGSDIQVVTSGFSLPDYNYVGVTYPINTTEVYTFKTGGSGGTTVATVTLVYTDSTKASLSTATRS